MEYLSDNFFPFSIWRPEDGYFPNWILKSSKVHIFWEDHNILRNLPLTFDYSTYSQKWGEDFAKFCGLLRIYELYHNKTVPSLALVTTSSFHYREFSKKCAVKPWYYKAYSYFSIFCPSRSLLGFVFTYISPPMLLLTHSCKIAMVGEFFCLLKFAHTGPFMWKFLFFAMQCCNFHSIHPIFPLKKR